MTWRENPPPAEESLKAMRTALQMGSNFWNAGELYGTPERNSLHLLNEYFEKYPVDADKVLLPIKGGSVPGKIAFDGSEANINRSIDECSDHSRGKMTLTHVQQTGQIKKYEDVDEHMKRFPRFQPEHFEQNMELVRAVESLAKQKNATVGQIALAWVKAQSNRNGNGKIIPIPGATKEGRVKENMTEIQMSYKDLEEVDRILSTIELAGSRGACMADETE